MNGRPVPYSLHIRVDDMAPTPNFSTTQLRLEKAAAAIVKRWESPFSFASISTSHVVSSSVVPTAVIFRDRLDASRNWSVGGGLREMWV